MFKRIGVWGSPFYLAIFWLGVAVSAGAVCGASPPLPPDGFTWPVTGGITETWSLDCRTDRGHRGVDIAADAGTVIRAAAAGTIGFVGYTPAESGGTTITINHEGGLRTTYLHVAGPRVSSGEAVSQGQTIATANGSPLHFGIKLVSGNHEAYFNPLQLLPGITSDTGPAPETLAPEPLPQPVPVPETPVPPAAIAPVPELPAQPVPVELPGAAPLPTAPAAVEQPVPPVQVQPLPALPAIQIQPFPAAISSTQVQMTTSAIHPDPATVISIPDTALSVLEPAVPYTRTAGMAAGTNFGMIKTRLTAPLAAGQKQTRVIKNTGPGRRLAVAAAVLLLSAVAVVGGRMAGSVESAPCFGQGKSSC